jgi:hypothetical protein
VLRVVKSASSCHQAVRRGRHRNPEELPVSWSQQGPRGAQGVQGPQGGQGIQGLPGIQGPQGPGAISINRGSIPGDDRTHVLATFNGVDVYYGCSAGGGGVLVGVEPHQSGDTVFVSGDKAEDGGAVTSVQSSSTFNLDAGGISKANFDVIAWVGSVGKLARFDLGGFSGGSSCNIWGVVIPGS